MESEPQITPSLTPEASKSGKGFKSYSTFKFYEIFKNFLIIPKLKSAVTFEPFDGFWNFLCLGIGFWVWEIHF